MDETAALDSLANLLTELSQTPYDISLHAQHIRLAQLHAESLGESQVHAAREMLTTYLAASEEVWLPMIEAKQQSIDAEVTVEGVEELLALYQRAEADYMSIPILQKHLNFLISRHAHYHSPESEYNKPEELGEIFSTEWTRASVSEIVGKGAGHLTQSHTLWDIQRDWEMEMLEAAPPSDREALVNHVDSLHLTRLQQPHSNHEETSQSYSTFVSTYKPPGDYESLLVSASKLRAKAVKSYERREEWEMALARSSNSLQSFSAYLASERRARYPDLFILGGVYERAIAEAARRRFSGEASEQNDSEVVLSGFWMGYCDTLRINNAEEHVELDVLRRAVRSVPGSGEVWARFMRFLERTVEVDEQEDAAESDSKETVSTVFQQSLSTGLIQKDVEQIVPVFLARAGYEKRRLEAGKADAEAFATLVKVLEQGIELIRAASPNGDSRLRLEKYLTEIYLRLADSPDSAIDVWQRTAKVNKTSYLAWTAYTDVLIKQNHHAQARAVFKDLAAKNLDWPEAIWEAWVAFEHLYGSVEELEECLDRVEKAQYQVNARRAKEAEKASYEAMQIAMEQQAASVPVAEVVQERAAIVQTASQPMEVDMPVPTNENKTKRKAEEPPQQVESSKKARFEPKPPPLKRDRENCTVFVADLPLGVSEDDLTGLFKDCGKVREVKITQLPNALVATVEFFERDSVPAALTKDKKRLQGEEVAVHLAWKSTLYVTNFPEKADDQFMRELFGKHGVIFDVRWPSKKFKNTRRFCYVQYTSPSSAEKALELHGRELEPDQPMNVFLSNPERRKERTDADANEREIYVAGLSKFTTKLDLENLFKAYGEVKEVRMATEKDGNSKGFAFVEFEQESDAQAALGANNYELKKRRIAVTLADSRVRARNKNQISESGLGQKAETKSRSVRIRNLPAGTQEGLLQQVLEKHALIKRVEVFIDQKEAVVELESAAEAGKLLLRTDPIIFGENPLELSEEGRDGPSGSRPTAPPPKAGGLFVPRAAASRPRAGLGHSKKLGTGASGLQSNSRNGGDPSSQPKQGRGQDDFRKMLGGG